MNTVDLTHDDLYNAFQKGGIAALLEHDPDEVNEQTDFMLHELMVALHGAWISLHSYLIHMHETAGHTTPRVTPCADRKPE